jgi:hydrogenase maturation protein HypF
MNPATQSATARTRIATAIVLHGRVQGLGVRPAVARLARRLGLCGSVRNSRSGVVIHLEGAPESIEAFCETLERALPEATEIADLERRPAGLERFTAFEIEQHDAGSMLGTRVPLDAGVCERCMKEVENTGDRRFAYAFTSCTECGPRYSIIESMPWERGLTSMRHFALCAACRSECESDRDRRYHAQTNACPACGPRLSLTDAGGTPLAENEAALHLAGEHLREGRIVAVKGVGGYQLLCDATCEAAVARLRQRKHRSAKPLAVMVGSLEEAAALVFLDDVERNALASPANPIVLLRERPGTALAPGINAGFGTVGLFLPTSPLHALLLNQSCPPLVVTSGNTEGEPLEFDNDAAGRRLGEIADCLLHHDREIVRPIDDSVVRCMAGRVVTIRNARGLAPLPLGVPGTRSILAVGAHQKSAVALSNGAQAVLGPHLGDLETLAARERVATETQKLLDLYNADPELVVHDAHPDYFTTRWAQESGRPTLAVQHHHAHIVSGMVEQGWLERTVLGAAFDGTGYGEDGTIWGGEFLLCTTRGYERFAHLRPFSLAGGERAIREPWRVAVALVVDACGEEALERLIESRRLPAEARSLFSILRRPRLAPLATSAGRLFDGIAALALGIHRADFEGAPAMRLESLADANVAGAYRIDLDDGSPVQLDWRELIRRVVSDVLAGTEPAAISMRFHRGLAHAIHAVAERCPGVPVVLSGGVFQNRLLVELCREAWADCATELALPGTIPPNDGGLAAGQLAIGAQFLADNSHVR